MQFEDFDSKVRQAAEQHHANYDEKAWAKMEKLLNRYLPQKNDRRRIVFFLLLFLFLGGGVWMVISKPWQPGTRTLTTDNTVRQPAAANEQTKKSTTGNLSIDKKENSEPRAESPGNPSENLAVPDNKRDKEFVMQKQGRTKNGITDKVHLDDSYNILTSPGVTSKKDQPGEIINDDKIKSNSSSDRNIAASPADNSDAKKNDPSLTQVDLAKQAEPDKVITKKDEAAEQPKAVNQKDVVTKSHGKKTNTFFFSFAAAPDISAVELNKPGKVKLLAGAGFGYTIRDRWTIRTGFYTGRKIYTASKEEYKPSSPIMNYNYLDKIDADCKVYEIPLDVAYDFDRSERHNMFVSAGLSSYLMKKETYVYWYKWPGAQPTSYQHTVNNENKHFFSVLTLSAGYQRRINKTFSIGAEPYLKLPLSGLGYGKIKLNSTGILFSVAVKPFK